MKKETYDQLAQMLEEALTKETAETLEEYLKENPPLRFIGKFDYHCLMHEIKKEAGDVALTENARYFCDGQRWLIGNINNVCRFKVKDRGHVLGRGYYTVIDNEEGIPITLDSTIRKDLKSLQIVGIEKMKGATDILPSWSLITKEKTKGDIITIDLDGVRTLTKILNGDEI